MSWYTPTHPFFYEKRTISSDGFAQDASRNTP